MNNIWCCFGVGIFFGVFIVDIMHSLGIMNKFREFAREHNSVVHYESVKVRIRSYHDGSKKRYPERRPPKPITQYMP